jgi:hypothetical protein
MRKKKKTKPKAVTSQVRIRLDCIVDIGRETTHFPYEMSYTRTRRGARDFIFGGLDNAAEFASAMGVLTGKSKLKWSVEPIWTRAKR